MKRLIRTALGLAYWVIHGIPLMSLKNFFARIHGYLDPLLLDEAEHPGRKQEMELVAHAIIDKRKRREETRHKPYPLQRPHFNLFPVRLYLLMAHSALTS